MTDRPGWMPNFMVVLEIQDGNYEYGEIDRAFRLTGIRAKIEELESLVLDGLVAGYGSYRLVDRARARIAELREELAK